MKLWKNTAVQDNKSRNAKYFGFFLALLTAGGLFLGIPFALQAATFSVDSTGDGPDANPGDGNCATASATCTLRAGIQEANALGGGDVIDFTGLGGGQQTITVNASGNGALPNVTEQLVIDAGANWDGGYGSYGRPGIRLTKTGSVNDGLHFTDAADNSRISGLTIDGFDRRGVYFAAEDSQIGLDCLGTPSSQQRNVFINNGVINPSYNTGGVFLDDADRNNVAGNWISLDEDGASLAYNSISGLTIEEGDDNVIGFEDSDNPGFSCTAVQARNYLAPSDPAGSFPRPVFIYGGAVNDARRNIISGNHINISLDGNNILEYSYVGIYLHNNANYNFIGTDGDGKEDSQEGNVMAGFNYGSVYFQTNADTTNRNRVSGNIIGGDPTGTFDIYQGSTEWGVFMQRDSYENIVGFCDDSDEAGWAEDMCSNSGAAADQRNYLIGNTADSSEPGAGVVIGHNTTSDHMVYGNYFGAGTDGSAVPNDVGFQLRFGTDHKIGGSGSRANLFKYNEYGIWGYYRNYGDASSNAIFSNNTVTENTSHGIYLDMTNSMMAGPADWPTITGNTVTSNGGSGVYLRGSSVYVYQNDINNNSEYGIIAESVVNTLLSGGASRSPYNDKQTHLDSANDVVAKPEIGGPGNENTINGNSSGGIYFVDAMASNEGTLYSGNNIGDNNGNFDIRSTWWGAVEILFKDLTPIKSGSNTVYVVPQSGATYSGSTLDNGEFTSPPYPAGDTDEGAWGPGGFDYDNEPTWFRITDYEYDVNGNRTDYGPFTIKVSGDYANDALSPTFTFNGKDDDTNPGGLPSYYDTDGLWRYQIADAIVSTVPDRPVNQSPSNGAVDQPRDATLTASAFADAAETHAASQWKVFTSSAQCAADSGAVLDTGDAGATTSYAVPYGSLAKGATYWWHVRYKNSYGNYSDYSSCTVFTTSPSNVVRTGTVPDQAWDEDTILEKAFDLDDYFEDLRGLAMHYEVLGSDSPAHIDVHIGTQNKATFIPDDDWHGTETVTFKAIDSEGDTRNSNQITLTVNNVNDPPGRITKGFSPANGATTSSRAPTLKWTPPSDPDHAKSELYYRVRIGKDSDPESNYEHSYISATGVPEVVATNQLDDEATYYWTVRAVDPGGLKGEWSKAKHFYVNTALEPEIALTKTVTVGTTPLSWLNRIIKMAMAAAGPEGVEFREIDYTAYQIPLWSLLFIFLTVFLVTLALSGGLARPHQVIFRSPARSFPKIASANKKGTWQVSYDRFKRNARANHWAAIGAGAVTAALVLFAAFSPAIRAADDNGVPVEPGNYLKYTLTYRNTGDGDATSINIRDYVPAGTYLTSYGGSASIKDTTIDFSDSSLAPGQTKSVSFTVRVTNPCFVPEITGSAASFSSNEVSGGASSSQTSNPLESSILTYHVQDPEGYALPGSYVYIYQNGYKVSSGVADENGELTFGGLGSGVYYAEAFGPSSYPATATAYTSLGRNSSAFQTVVLKFEEEEEDEYIVVIVNEEEIKIPRHVGPPQTEEERRELKETMENFLKLLMVNETNVESMDFFEATYADVPGIEEYVDEEGKVKTLINVAGPELVLKGLTLPYATVTVIVRSEEVVRVTKADEYGRWEIRVPMELLPEGEHTVYAKSELYGVETDEIVLGRFVVPEEDKGLSSTMWLFIINLGLLVAFAIFMFFYTRKRGLTFKKKA